MDETAPDRSIMGWPRLVLFAVLLIALVAGCRNGDSDSARVETDSIEATEAGDTDSGQTVTRPKQIDLIHPVVRLDTSAGAIVIELDAEHSPGTVRNFLNYVNESFYDNTLVHYVDAGKMIVCGGYSQDHSLKVGRQPIRNEAHNGLKNVRGAVAMARDASHIDSASTQFFINLADAPQRDHLGETAADYGYCVFGKVIEGLDVAEKISQSKTTDLGSDLMQTPDPPIVITSISVMH